MASSPLYPGELVIGDTTPEHVTAEPAGMSRGLDLSSRPHGYAYGGVAEPFPADLLIPESEWQARIKEMEERKSRISDICIQGDLPCKDQNGTSQCWVNAPTHCIEIIRLVQNQEKVILSPSSVGGPVKNFRDPGGWGKEALEYGMAHGWCPVDKWPANAINRQYWTEENKQLALKYRQTEWWELRPRNTAELISCLLRRMPTAVGLNWWSHEVTYCDPVWLDGTVVCRIRNSWGMNWPSANAGGWSILQGSKMLPDDACAPRVAIAS